MTKTLFRYFVLILAITFVSTFFAWAEEIKEERSSWLQGIEVLTGYSQAELDVQGKLRAVPLIVDLDFDLKPLLEKINFKYFGMLQFQLEPYITTIYEPASDVELGNAFALKIGLVPAEWKFQPYIKMATGLSYMTLHTQEQGTQFNFIEYGGAGFHYYFNTNWGITAEYRFRHLSNSGIDEPNSGINTDFALLGLTYQF